MNVESDNYFYLLNISIILFQLFPSLPDALFRKYIKLQEIIMWKEELAIMKNGLH